LHNPAAEHESAIYNAYVHLESCIHEHIITERQMNPTAGRRYASLLGESRKRGAAMEDLDTPSYLHAL
jgi:hypothetical protein